ncbi:MAG TPA: RecQ family ATP-dependent DNA helicase [Candidatus Limnocylindrales bacterium]|nr:RecQ family ATP-dependent DNA helicase [Candidatus Limnocylindrales bacterium]
MTNSGGDGGRHHSPARIQRAARELLNLEELMPGQAEAVAAVLEGRDTLAVLPTGGGKSAIYQIAGALIPGSTVVISPLLALQRDQLQSIEGMEAGEGALINSTLRARQREETLDLIEDGALEFILLAPEQLADSEVLDALEASSPSLFVVDEAHCLSDWGHDFRPDYLRLREVVRRLGHPTILALTATAAPPVREEIIERLAMRKPAVIVHGFDRPNIHLEVVSRGDERAKIDALTEAIANAQPPGIVYAATRQATEDLADRLISAGVRAAAYHAGMPARERERVQDAFMADRGEIDVIVATTAFGMGVDKPNVRFVFHASASESLDAYHQEIGRAGRDGAPSRAVLFYRAEDLGLRRYFAARGRLQQETLEQVVEWLRASASRRSVPVEQIAQAVDLSRAMTMRALDRLSVLEACTLDKGRARANPDDQRTPAEVAGEAVAAEERRLAYDRSRVEMMRAYAETRECRRNFLLNYFGEGAEGGCGRCDNDLRAADQEVGGRVAGAQAAGQDVPFELNSRVRHSAFGEGTVQHYDDGGVTVLFDDGGYKTLDADHAVNEGLLKLAGA